MNKSRFNKEEKLNILKQRDTLKLTVAEVCVKNGISIPTYYNWKRELKSISTKKVDKNPDVNVENKILRRLYIDLSEHNYQLAQFLNQ